MQLRVVFIGQHRWAQSLAELVRRYGGGATAHSWTPGQTKIRATDLRRANALVRVGFRPGAATLRGVAMEAAWAAIRAYSKHAKVAYYWIGSDVTSAVEAFRSGSVLQRPFRESLRAVHFAGAPWFVPELAAIGIKAEELLFPSALPISLLRLEFPSKFRVLTYVPDSRARHYGAEFVERAAAALPDIPIDIVGGNGSWATSHMANVIFHGRVADMVPLYRNAAVVVRVIDHDALGATVREGLAAGRHVVYSNKVPHTAYLPFGKGDQLTDVLRRLSEAHRGGSLELNEAGRAYAKGAFDEGMLARAMISRLAAIAQAST